MLTFEFFVLKLSDGLEAASNDASHYLPKDWHGPGVDDGVDTTVKGQHHSRPWDARLTLTNRNANAKREKTDEECKYNNGKFLSDCHLMSVGLF